MEPESRFISLFSRRFHCTSQQQPLVLSETLQQPKLRAEKYEATSEKAWAVQDRDLMTRAGSSSPHLLPAMVCLFPDLNQPTRLAPPWKPELSHHLLRTLQTVRSRPVPDMRAFQPQHRRRPANLPTHRLPTGGSALPQKQSSLRIGSTILIVEVFAFATARKRCCALLSSFTLGILAKLPAHH